MHRLFSFRNLPQTFPVQHWWMVPFVFVFLFCFSHPRSLFCKCRRVRGEESDTNNECIKRPKGRKVKPGLHESSSVFFEGSLQACDRFFFLLGNMCVGGWPSPESGHGADAKPRFWEPSWVRPGWTGQPAAACCSWWSANLFSVLPPARELLTR